MLHKTSTKLALLYLAILMFISLAFSATVYQLSTQEFDRSFRRQGTLLRDGPGYFLDEEVRDQLLAEQQDRFYEAKLHELQRLLYINLIILIGGGFASYYLARRTLQPIEESHQALERFTADASHELRTPLSAMRTETEVTLMNPNLSLSTAKHQLRSNLEEIQNLTALTDGLLKLARHDADGFKNEVVPIKSLVDQSVEQVKSLVEQKQIEIQINPEAELKVRGDNDALAEVLVILLDNAIKYSAPKSHIRIESRTHQKQAEIDVIDEGIGITPADQKRIFERFYRADAARSKNQATGYGLGLAIAKDIVTLQGGSIGVESKPAKGSTFRISLPLEP